MATPKEHPATLESAELHRVGFERRLGVERKPQISITLWTPADVRAIHRLEKSTWPPWLSKPLRSINIIAHDPVKTETHLLAKAKDPLTHRKKVVGIMSATRIDWDGKPESLESWDAYAGGSVERSDYPKYKAQGRTLVIMSSSVDQAHQGQGVASKLFEAMKTEARNSSIQRIVGPFRPSGWGAYKTDPRNPRISFEDYCERVIADSSKDPALRDPRFKDPWLEAAMHMGMLPLRVDGRLRVQEHSMTVSVSIKQFKRYRETYKPDKWIKINGIWECDEAGNWLVVGNENDPDAFAIYSEPNLWGEIPLPTSMSQQRRSTR